ncbi:MAG: FxsA family protein [Acidimicrobiales bacterium]
MVALLFIVFLVVPLIELYVIIQVGQVIGALNTIAVLLIVSFAGAWLVKREGMGVARRFREQTALGRVPARELADGVLILFAGALLLTPGFVTDVLGILLLLPPVRSLIRAQGLRRVASRAQRHRY